MFTSEDMLGDEELDELLDEPEKLAAAGKEATEIQAIELPDRNSDNDKRAIELEVSRINEHKQSVENATNNPHSAIHPFYGCTAYDLSS